MPRNDDEARLEQLRARNRTITEHSGGYSPLELIQSGKAEHYSVSRMFMKYLLAFIMLLVTVAVLAAAVLIFLRIDRTVVENETDFSAEAVIEASGIREGQNLLLLDKNAVARKIAASIPYADNIKIKKLYPSGVSISLERGTAAYYVKKGTDYYVLSPERRVLARTSDIETLELSGAKRLVSKKISRCVVGEKIAFSDSDMNGVLDELEEKLREYGYFDFCTEICVDGKFDIRFKYDNRIVIKLGDLYDFDVKLQFVGKIMESIGENDSGEIDVSDRNLHEGVLTLYR